MNARLALAATLLAAPLAVADDWPHWMGPKRDNVWNETGILDKFPKDGPKKLWSAKVGQGYAGPSVVGDRVYVMDLLGSGAEQKERVLCLDTKDGAEVWKH